MRNRVRLSTSLPNSSVLEGTLFTACPITNLVAINTAPPPPNPSSALANQPGDYHIVPVSRIQSFQLLALPQDTARADGSSTGFDGVVPSIGRVDTKALEAREQAAIRKMKERDAARGRGVGREAQEIFDALARTYVCHHRRFSYLYTTSTSVIRVALLLLRVHPSRFLTSTGIQTADAMA